MNVARIVSNILVVVSAGSRDVTTLVTSIISSIQRSLLRNPRGIAVPRFFSDLIKCTDYNTLRIAL